MIKDIGYLEVLKNTIGASIQDQGRIGYANWGVPVSGALDHRSFSLANQLLGNKESDAVLELTQPGLICSFDEYALVSFAGAKVDILLNSERIGDHQTLPISPGDILQIGKFILGKSLYLGVKGGFQTKVVMKSRSQFQGITPSPSLQKSDRVPFFTSHKSYPKSTASVKSTYHWFEPSEIEVYAGPDFEKLSNFEREKLLSNPFTLSSASNRMAIQLDETVTNSLPDLFTAPVLPGTIQLTSGGKLLILMKDAQVTGGYPRIFQLTTEALSILAQKQPGEKIRFRLATIAHY